MDQFSDKARAGFRRGLEFLRSKTHETVEIHKSQSQVKELQRRHEECIRDLGYRVYQMLHEGALDPASLRERFNETVAIEREIDAHFQEQVKLREQLKAGMNLPFQALAPRGAPTCPQCGEVVMALSRFCGDCGARLGDPEG